MFAIKMINCVAFSLTITILIMFYESFCLRRYMKYFFICVSIDIFFNLVLPELNFLSLYYLVPLLSFQLYRENKNISICILYSLVVLLIFVLQTVLFGNLLICLVYKRFVTDVLSYNLIMAVSNIIMAIIIRLYKHGELLNICFISSQSIYQSILFCCISLVFLVYILPTLPISHDVISYCTITIFVVALIICVYTLLSNISHLEKKAHTLELKQKFDEKEKASFEKIKELKHYYLQLFRSCISFLEQPKNSYNHKIISYLNEINMDLDAEKENMENIQFIDNVLIRSLFRQMIHDVSLLPNIKLKVSLKTSMIISNIKELDLFKILSILLENALDAVQKQPKGYIHITISKESDCCILKISNSIPEIQTKQPYSFGVGLEIIGRIIARYPNLELETRILTERYDQIVVIRGK